MNLKNVMCVQEAAERWNVNVDTINSRIRTLAKNKNKFNGMVNANLIKQSHKTWILTKDLMTIWFGEETDMKKLISKWENELQHDVVNDETVDYWIYEISEQYSQCDWYGLKYIWIFKYELENGQTYYVVEEESASELVKQNDDNWTIRDRLLNPTHESGDHEIVGVFESEEDAYKFAKKGYEQIDVEKELDEILGKDEDN